MVATRPRPTRLPVRALTLGLLVAASVAADDVHLVNGAVFEDVETERTATHVVIEMAIGKMSLPLEQVDRIVPGPSTLGAFRERRAALLDDPSSEPAAWLGLARWGLAHGLDTEARSAALFAARLDPALDGLAPILGGLGYERVADVGWIPVEDANRLRGLVLHDGDWVTPAQRTARIGERLAEEERRAVRDRERGQGGGARSQADPTDNDVALASIELAREALQREDERTPRGAGIPGFGQAPGAVYPGVVLPPPAWPSPEAAQAYRERVRRDVEALMRRPPGSIIPLQTYVDQRNP